MHYPIFTIQTPEALVDLLAREMRVSKRRAKQYLDQKRVSVNGKKVWMAHHALKHGDRVEVAVHDEPKGDGLPPILFDQGGIVALDKPAGIPANGPNSLETLLVRAWGPSIRAVHRLDRDTTGCILFSRKDLSRKILVEQFRSSEIRKAYCFLACHAPAFRTRVVDASLDHRTAETRIKVLKKRGKIFLAEAEIPTGRTHQIRRHLALIGHPLLGDPKYGLRDQFHDLRPSPARCFLHASRIEFLHPETGKQMMVIAPLPEDFTDAMKRYHLSA